MIAPVTTPQPEDDNENQEHQELELSFSEVLEVTLQRVENMIAQLQYETEGIEG